jgi:endonuclease YncB( thermonuclease family)
MTKSVKREVNKTTRPRIARLCADAETRGANRIHLWKVITLLLLVTSIGFAESFVGKVIKATDGDTITVLRNDGANKISVKVRLAGIDTPERSQDYGSKAKSALSSKVFGKTVTIRYSEKDRYGRTIGDVYLGDAWINLQMVSEGFAWHYKHYSKDKQLAAAETNARASRKGLWADPKSPVPPWEFRRGKRTSKAKAKAPESGGLRWLNTSSGSRHNQGCTYFKNTKRGRMCGPNGGFLHPCIGLGDGKVTDAADFSPK